MSEKFVQLLLHDEVTEGDVERYIEAWVEGSPCEEELGEFLGMTDEQYAMWITNPTTPLKELLRKSQSKLIPN